MKHIFLTSNEFTTSLFPEKLFSDGRLSLTDGSLA